MTTSSRLVLGGAAAAALALIAGCGSNSSASATVSNPFGGGGVSLGGGGNVSIPTLPAGVNIPGLSSSSSQGGGGSLDACTAMSASTASQISGGTVVKLSGTTAGGVSQCSYADSASGAGAAAIIENIPGLAGSAALQAAMSQAAHGGSSSAQPVSGIGDTALKEVESNGATVAFAKGGTLVVVAVYGSKRDGNSIESDLESLAKQIAGQL
jgi:hypothetical protein